MITSLCAIGMPVSGPALPLARAASAALACASAPSASMVTNALSVDCALPIRSSSVCVSSTDDSFPAASCADSPAMVSRCVIR
jgi:hypothetical protein